MVVNFLFEGPLPLLRYLAFISVICYLYECRRCIEDFYRRQKVIDGDRSRLELRWLRKPLTVFGILWLLWLAAAGGPFLQNRQATVPFIPGLYGHRHIDLLFRFVWFCKEFTVLILIAFAISAPLGWHLMTQTDERFCSSHCPLTRAVGSIGSKWKPIIINVIREKTIRFGKLDAFIPHITRKVLTGELKELEEDGLVKRVAFKEIPPRVEYSLTEKGLALLPIIDSIKEWSTKY